jgi:hypothetical protein
MLLRLLSIILGVWLLSRVWRLFAPRRPGPASRVEREEPPASKRDRFGDGKIQEGEFEEVEDSRRSGSERP